MASLKAAEHNKGRPSRPSMRNIINPGFIAFWADTRRKECMVGAIQARVHRDIFWLEGLHTWEGLFAEQVQFGQVVFEGWRSWGWVGDEQIIIIATATKLAPPPLSSSSSG